MIVSDLNSDSNDGDTLETSSNSSKNDNNNNNNNSSSDIDLVFDSDLSSDIFETNVNEEKIEIGDPHQSYQFGLKIAGLNVCGIYSSLDKRIQLNAWMEHQDLDIL